jgi:hypothetical protein
MMAREEFRRETGLRPEDRGESEGDTGDDESRTGDADADGWAARSICTVNSREPSYSDPTTGGVDTTAIEGRREFDPPPHRE